SHDRAKRSEWSRVLAGFAPAAPERLGSPRRSPGPQEDTAPRYNRRSMEAADTSIHGGLEARTRRRAEAILSGVTVDIGGVPVLLHASDRRRADAMAAVLVGVPQHADPKALAVLMTSEAATMPSRPPDETFDDMAAWQSGGEFALQSASGLSVFADHARAHIGGDALDLNAAFRTVFPAAITHLLA